MDASAVQRIEETAIAAAKANRLGSHVPAVILSDGQSVKNIEELDGCRSYFRGHFKTGLLSAFAAYVKAHPDGEGFVDDEHMSARWYHNLQVDDDTPGLCDWCSDLILQPTAAFAAVQRIGARFSQRALIEWIEDWAPTLGTLLAAGAEPTSIAPGLLAARQLNVRATREVAHTDRDYKVTRSALEDIDASASGTMPYGFAMTTPPYAGFAPRTIILPLSVTAPGDGAKDAEPTLRLRVVGLDSLREAIVNEFRDLLASSIGHGAKLTIGTFTP